MLDKTPLTVAHEINALSDAGFSRMIRRLYTMAVNCDLAHYCDVSQMWATARVAPTEGSP